MSDTSMFYDPSKLLSYNAVYNFVVGGRGIGKTYAFKHRAIRDYIRHGRQFIVLRRYQKESATKHAFFDDIYHVFDDYDFRVHGEFGQISPVKKRSDKNRVWHTMCHFVALTGAQQKKGTSYPNVHTIIFDEFILEKGHARYLADEFTAFNNFYSTVDRYQDRVKVFFLANSVSIMNPYFLELDIVPGKQEYVSRANGFAVAHFPNSEQFTNHVYQTRFGQFIRDTEYAEYAVGNTFMDNHDMMIAIKDSRASYLFTIETPKGTFSVWHSMREQTFFMQTKQPKNVITYTMMPEQMGDNKLLLLPNDPLLQTLKTAFRQGRVVFNEPSTRNAFIEVSRR